MAASLFGGGGKFGGIPDIVTDGVNGHLFDPRDEKGLISATRRLLTAKAEREELRRNARLEAEKLDLASGHQTIIRLLSPGFE
jgi:glycosyltransferase involved in cell wall biosynthesis